MEEQVKESTEKKDSIPESVKQEFEKKLANPMTPEEAKKNLINYMVTNMNRKQRRKLAHESKIAWDEIPKTSRKEAMEFTHKLMPPKVKVEDTNEVN